MSVSKNLTAWLLIAIVLFTFLQFFSTFYQQSKSALNCRFHPNSTRQFSIEHLAILNRLDLIDSTVDRFGSIDAIIASIPIFVSAWSSNHHAEADSLCKHIIAYKGMRADEKTFIVYNIGLTNEEMDNYRKSCSFVQFRNFNFSVYPPHVRNLKEYRWKPLIIAEILLEFASIWWLDTSIRFTTGNISMAHTYNAFRGANNTRLKFGLFGWSIQVLFGRYLLFWKISKTEIPTISDTVFGSCHDCTMLS